jgi:hypothetical protein
MAFFDDIFGGLFGQQKTPQYKPLSVDEILGQVSASLPTLANQNLDYNERLAAPLTRIQRQAEDVYDPNQGRLREATTTSILNELGLGGALPRDIQDQVIQNAFENAGGAGIGTSQAGRNLVARDLGLTSLDLRNQRLDRAAQITRSAPSLNQIFSPRETLSPSDVANLFVSGENAQNQAAQEQAAIESQNRRNLFTTPLNLLGTAAGIYGNVAGGGTSGILSNLFGGRPSSVRALPF